MLKVGSCGQLQRSGDSNVEKPLLKGKRDREFGSVSPSEQEQLLSERQLFKENAWLREGSGRRNSDMALYETNRQVESQLMELYHVDQWAGQAQMENHRIYEELAMKSRLYQENHALDCMEMEELRRNGREETDRARQLRTDELHAQKKDEPSTSTVNRLSSPIQTLQDKVNALNEDRAALESPTFPVNCREFRVQRNDKPRFWIAALYTELDGYLRKRF